MIRTRPVKGVLYADWCSHRDNGNNGDESSPDYLPNVKAGTDAFGVGKLPPAGPLMTAAIALFGNNSFLHPIADNSSALSPGQTLTLLCKQGGIPFTQVTEARLSGDLPTSRCNNIQWKSSRDGYEESAPDRLDGIIASWFGLFGRAEDAEYLLMVSTFLANKAVLRQAAMGPIYRKRPIYHDGCSPVMLAIRVGKLGVHGARGAVPGALPAAYAGGVQRAP